MNRKCKVESKCKQKIKSTNYKLKMIMTSCMQETFRCAMSLHSSMKMQSPLMFL
jgi:hypothetical protein